jgi:formylglycine-generating enzyme required for sulfatase activity
MKSRALSLLAGVSLIAGSPTLWAAEFGDFGYESSGTRITITGYYGPGGDVAIPDSILGLPVTSIRSHAFSNLPGPTRITIPDSVTIIERWAFFGSTSLTAIEVDPANAFFSSLDGVLFNKNQTALIRCPGGRTGTYTIPDSVTSIRSSAFADCTGLTSVIIPGSVTSIGDSAFSNCTGLTSIIIPGSVTSIGDEAFSRCTGLTSVTIPDSVTSIGDLEFWGCTSLTAIDVDPANPFYSSLDGVLFNKSQTELVLCPGGRSTITIPASVTRISEGASAGCWRLQAVYFYGDAPTMEAGAFAQTIATLFHVLGTTGWEATMGGRPTASWNGRFGAQRLEIFSGLTIAGEVGKVYSVEYITDLSRTHDASAWRCLEYLQLPASQYLWTDESAPATDKKFYRAVAMEPPTNMVFIPPGTFRMGSPTNEVDRYDSEGPQTDVIISRGFWMGKYEVTQGDYLAVLGINPSNFQPPKATADINRPVESVSWYDAVIYCYVLTERERAAQRIPQNCVYRLPTEAEWEYACRAWTSTRFSYGDDLGYTNLTNYAWAYPNSDHQIHPAGQKLPNPWGLYDMHGNVWEWCQDSYGDYPGGIVLDPQPPATGWGNVIRGGGWYYSARACRSAQRRSYTLGHGDFEIGFRVVLAPGQP